MPTWGWILSIISGVILAVGGGIAKLMSTLVGKYFESLSQRIALMEGNLQRHTAAEEVFQDKILTLINNLNSSLIRLETGREMFVTRDNLNDAIRRVEGQIADSRHATNNKLAEAIIHLETKIERLRGE